MSNVSAIEGNTAIKKKVLKNIGTLIGEVIFCLTMARNQLRDAPFGINLIPLIKGLMDEKIDPSIKNIKKIQVQLELLKRMKFAKNEVEEVNELVNDLFISVFIVKRKLEEIKGRALALAIVCSMIEKNMNPAIRKCGLIKKKLEDLAHSNL